MAFPFSFSGEWCDEDAPHIVADLMSVCSNSLAPSVPWIVGSIGTLAFDVTIIIQYFIFGAEPEKPVETVEIDQTLIGTKQRSGNKASLDL